MNGHRLGFRPESEPLLGWLVVEHIHDWRLLRIVVGPSIVENYVEKRLVYLNAGRCIR